MDSINTLDKPQSVIFNGVKYDLMGAKRYYLESHTRKADRVGVKSLHTAIWEYYNGKEVPNDCCIHHKDKNPFNNDISNLECMNRTEHNRLHAKENLANPEYCRKINESLKLAREKAKDWHHSEEGRRWHSEHAKNQVRIKKKLKCVQCGKGFESVYKDAMYCSPACGDKHRYWRDKLAKNQQELLLF